MSLPEGVGLQLNSLGPYPHVPGGPHTRSGHLDFRLHCPYLGSQVRVGPAPSAFDRRTLILVQLTAPIGPDPCVWGIGFNRGPYRHWPIPTPRTGRLAVPGDPPLPACWPRPGAQDKRRDCDRGHSLA